MKSVRINRTEIFNQVQQALKLLEDPERRVGQMKYFKETIDSLGIPMPEVLKLTKAFWKQINGSSKDDIFKLCEALWKTGNFESPIMPGRQNNAGHAKHARRILPCFFGIMCTQPAQSTKNINPFDDHWWRKRYSCI